MGRYRRRIIRGIKSAENKSINIPIFKEFHTNRLSNKLVGAVLLQDFGNED